ncbi:hypothetical protein T492DRAFT_1117374 [Pavlovales sp. CCMP2436]|nr:hypothetical protein T492DRAFT_1117374 [Pavlovales sp. CCMP2436]
MVKNTIYNRVQEERAHKLSDTKQGSCDLVIADDKLEWRYASTSSFRNKGFNKMEMDEKILCYERTHHAGAYFNEREIRHSPDLLGITLPNGEKLTSPNQPPIINIIKASGIHKERTIETIGGHVHSQLLTFSAEARKKRSEAIIPGGRHDVKAAWTEQKGKGDLKRTQTSDTNNNSGTPNTSQGGGAGPRSANGGEQNHNITGTPNTSPGGGAGPSNATGEKQTPNSTMTTAGTKDQM